MLTAGRRFLSTTPATPLAILVTGVVLGLAGITWIRAAYDGYHAAFGLVLLWQAAVWTPWMGFGVVVFRLSQMWPFVARPQRWLIPHLLAAIAITAIHYLWFRFASSQLSPYFGLEDTRYGVFAYFFVFWSTLDLALYALLFTFAQGRQIHARQLDSSRRVAELEGALFEWRREPERDQSIDYLLVRKSGKRQIVSAERIYWIEAEGYYAGLHTKDGEFLIRESLAGLAKKLNSSQFVRVHRSTIVNLDFVDCYDSTGDGKWIVRLADGTKRPVSRSGRRRLESLML